LKTKLLTLTPIVLSTMILSGCTATDPEVARDRECRAVDSPSGSRMRESLCLSKAEWQRIDARQAAILAESDATDEYLRRTQEYNSQHVSAPGDSYDPYPGY